jgi:hypothetical protein
MTKATKPRDPSTDLMPGLRAAVDELLAEPAGGAVTAVDVPHGYETLAHYAVGIGLPLASVLAAVRELGIVPRLLLNDQHYYSAVDLARVATWLRERQSTKARAGARVTTIG